MISSNLEAMLAKKQKKKCIHILAWDKTTTTKKKETSVFPLLFLLLNFYFL